MQRAANRALSPLYLDLGGDHRDAVFVAGSGRSGTTWLSEIINHRGDYRYIFEPFHPDRVALARPFGYRRYVRPGDEQPELRERARKIVRGEVRGPWVDRFHRRFVARGRLIKDIRANLMLAWLAAEFPEMPVILLLRHPCAVALSRTRLGWRSRLDEFMEQPALVQDFLAPVAEEMRAARTEFERHVFVWCVESYVPLTQLGEGRAHLVFYERLRERPEEEIGGLFHYLGAGAREVPPKAFRAPSALSRSDSATSSDAAVDRWRGELSEEQVRRAVEILGYFGLDRVYSESPMPDARAAWEIMEGASWNA